MSFENIDKILAEIEERIRSIQRTSTSIALGNEKNIIVIDALPTSRELHLACLVDGCDARILVTRLNDKAQEIVQLLEDGKCASVRCRVFGNRITEIVQVDEYRGTLTPNMAGVLRRARTGSRFWIDTKDGKSYLISDFSIKGMKLNGEANDGDIVVMFTFPPETTQAGVQVLKYFHYQILRKEESEAKTETETEVEVESKVESSSEVEERAVEEVEKIESDAEREIEAINEVDVEHDNDSNMVDLRHIVESGVLKRVLMDVFKNEKICNTIMSVKPEKCVEHRDVISYITCLIENSQLSQKMKRMLIEKVRSEKVRIEKMIAELDTGVENV